MFNNKQIKTLEAKIIFLESTVDYLNSKFFTIQNHINKLEECECCGGYFNKDKMDKEDKIEEVTEVKSYLRSLGLSHSYIDKNKQIVTHYKCKVCACKKPNNEK